MSNDSFVPQGRLLLDTMRLFGSGRLFDHLRYNLFNYPCNLNLFCLYIEEESSLAPMSCDVVVVGGGISGMYMAETLMRMKKEDNVCLFEKESRFGGRDFDVRFSRAPNISISKD